MESPKVQTKIEAPCWKKKTAEGGFYTNFKDHIDEFVNSSMDQHKICLKKTIRGMGDFVRHKKEGSMFKSSKAGNDRESAVKEVESSSSAA